MPINFENQKLNGLDHLRSLAIVLVFLFHYFKYFPHPHWVEWFNMGWTGVDLFFVISGFLISSQLFLQIKTSQTIYLRTFFIKRFFRIFPNYYFILAVYFVFPWAREKEALAPLWKYLTFTQNFDIDIVKRGTFSHAWSLCVEEHFYLCLPFLLFFLIKIKKMNHSYWIIIVLFFLGLLIRGYLWNSHFLNYSLEDLPHYQWYELIYYPTYNRLDGLLLGVGISAFYHFCPVSWNSISKFGNLWIGLGLIILFSAYFIFTDLFTKGSSVFIFPYISIGYGFLLIGAISPNSFLFNWQSKIISLLAMLSYGLYLSHKMIIHLVQELCSKSGIEKDGNIMLIISILFCCLTSLILHWIIEKPFMSMRNRFLRLNKELF